MNKDNFDYETKNLWQPMINLDDLIQGNNRLSLIIAAIYGWVYNLYLLNLNTFSWEFLIKGMSGVVFAASCAFVVKVTKDFYEIKVKDKIFRNEKDKKKRYERNEKDSEKVA